LGRTDLSKEEKKKKEKVKMVLGGKRGHKVS